MASGSFHDGFYGQPISFYGVSDSVDVLVEGISSEEAFGTASLSHQVAPTGIGSAEAFGTLTTVYVVDLSDDGIPAGEVGAPTVVSAPWLIEPAGVESGEAFGTAHFGTILGLVGIPSAETFGIPDVTGYVSPVGIPSTEAFGLLKTRLGMVVPGIPSAEVVPQPTIFVSISTVGIPSAETFGVPKTQHSVHVVGIASGEAFGTPRQGNAVGVAPIPSGETFGTAMLGHTVVVFGIGSEETIGSPSINVLRVYPVGIGSVEAVGTPGVSDDAGWWSHRHVYRRRLVVEAISLEMLPVGHPVEVTVPFIREQGKIRLDLEDVEVLYRVDGTWVRVPRQVTEVADGLQVRFRLVDEVLAHGSVDYYLYYGSQLATAGRTEFTDELWPIRVLPGSPLIDYTRPTEHWRAGVSVVPGARASFEFSGTDVRFLAPQGPEAGIAEIQLDDNPWVESDLRTSTFEPLTVIATWTGLVPGSHRVRVRAVHRRAAISIGAFDYVAMMAVSDRGEEVLEDEWASLVLVGDD